MSLSAASPPFTVARGLSPLPPALARPVLAIGNFDGVHRGHLAVIGAARGMAQRLGRPSAALTFTPHPRAFFQKSDFFDLTPGALKIEALRRTGLDGAVILPFDATLASLDATAFVEQVLKGCFDVAGIVVGFDFHFGKGREGSPAFMRAAGERHGFEVEVVAAMLDEGDPVSSTAIRNALAAGQVGHAAHMLGRPWSVRGTVIHGDKRGRDLGYPTANLRLPAGTQLAFGIYAVQVRVDGALLNGVASYGRRPTFDDGAPLLEIHIFDFAGNLYDAEIDVFFHNYLRPELKFGSVDDLVAQMDKDSAQARALLPPISPAV